MDPQDNLQLPFLTRDMLSFKHGLKIGLRITSQSYVATTLIISGVTRSGKFLFKHTTTADGVIKTEDFGLPDIPIFVSVIDSGTSTLQGGLFSRLSLLLDEDKLLALASGYVYKDRSIGWPMTQNDEGRVGGGRLVSSAGSLPAAGAEVDITVPTGRTWRLMSLQIGLTTGVAVALRRVHIRITKGGDILYDFFSNIDQAESLFKTYMGQPVGVIPASEDNNSIIIPIAKDIILPANAHIITATTNIQAADQFEQPIYYVEEYMSV